MIGAQSLDYGNYEIECNISTRLKPDIWDSEILTLKIISTELVAIITGAGINTKFSIGN